MTSKKRELVGLTSGEARCLQERYGKNELTPQSEEGFLKKMFHILREPMFLLLMAASVIYFILGEPRDGAIMLIFVIGMISIDVMQEWKTDKTLAALKELSAPHITVVRDGREQVIASVDLVPGDLMIIVEGVKIPADGLVVKCSDFSVDESSLTGEAEPVWKGSTQSIQESMNYFRTDYCYAGTLVIQGSATILVDKIGSETEYGKIGVNVATALEEPSPLQRQTRCLVRLCAVIAAGFFMLVGVGTYTNLSDHRFHDRIIESILSGVTLAMAMIPEEFPVILTVFLSMGAWRLAKKSSLVRKLSSVETLGAVSVLCVDKTGTITRNQMTVVNTWALDGEEECLLETMGLGCEMDVYDPMEKAMLRYCEEHGIYMEELFRGELMREYAFTNALKMMGHVWKCENQILIAAKGCPERILALCEMDRTKIQLVEEKIVEMSREGLRVIGVAIKKLQTEEEIPLSLMESKLTFLGLIGLTDPPRESVKQDIAVCNKAGIRVVMITGDNGITATSIAKQVGMKHSEHIITGDMLEAMTEEELRQKVRDVNIFSRVLPEHKMRIVKAFKENGEIVAMTGDGVNDAPALKYADIGIAMGKRGSEVSREAADLILLDDNFTTIVETVKDGRRIYDNIRKAIGYVFTIHIPIAFSSLLAPLFGISPSALLLLPLHVVLLELLIDPTCSVVLERQPAEEDIMERRPRAPQERLLTSKLLLKSILQGILMFAASFGTYLTVLHTRIDNADVARSMGLTIIILGNLFLVIANSSENEFSFRSMKKLVKDKVMRLVFLGTMGMVLLILYSPLREILKLASLTGKQLLLAIGIAGISIFWYELVKLVRKVLSSP